MRRSSRILWGIIIISVGVLFGLNALGVTDVDLFFDGWWTLFIIVPCAVRLFYDHDKTGNIIGLCVGVFLLLCCQDVLGFDMLWKLLLPAIIIIFGIKMVFGGVRDGKSDEVMKKIQAQGEPIHSSAAVFSGENLDFTGEVFRGGELNAVFGGVKCDLRNAIFEGDCVVHASAVFGGIDIYVPDTINIKLSSNSIFGGASNKTKNIHDDHAITLYVKADCLFGGVDIQ